MRARVAASVSNACWIQVGGKRASSSRKPTSRPRAREAPRFLAPLLRQAIVEGIEAEYASRLLNIIQDVYADPAITVA